MNKRTGMATLVASVGLLNLMLLSSAGAGSPNRETAEDAQIDVMVATAKTKADHLKISATYAAEAKAEAAKAQTLRDQTEAYKTHKHDFYSRTILDLMEHTDALARNYQEAADRHKYLAEIHEQIAAEMKR